MKTFNHYSVAYFLARITRPVGEPLQQNDLRFLGRYLPIITVTNLASIAVAASVMAQSELPAVPVAISLNSVTAISTNDVWAVGNGTDSQDADNTDPAFEHWDGTSWSFISVPAHPTLSSTFTDVVALASNDVWAVGSAFDPTIPSRSHTLTMHWDGTAWRRVPSPDTGRFNADGFATVTAISPSDICAVGNDVDHGDQTLTEHWNGTSWSIVPAPGSFLMNDAAALASDDVWAVGWMINRSIIQHWDGSLWSVVPSP